MIVGMYDLHCHILPNVDDGAKSLDDAIEMARVAFEHGTGVIVATPHRRDVTENSSVGDVEELLSSFNSRLEKEGIGLRVLKGMENHLDPDLPGDLSSGRALPLNGSRYALVELPFFGYPNYVEDVLFKMQVQGLTPVLAHPERIEAFQKRPELLYTFVERGMLTQITAGSVLGHFGGKVRRLTHDLLRGGLVHLLASDAHFPNGSRSPRLPPGVEAAAVIVGPDKAKAMVVDMPQAILEDMPVEVEAPSQPVSARRWWRPWG